MGRINNGVQKNNLLLVGSFPARNPIIYSSNREENTLHALLAIGIKNEVLN